MLDKAKRDEGIWMRGKEKSYGGKGRVMGSQTRYKDVEQYRWGKGQSCGFSMETQYSIKMGARER